MNQTRDRYLERESDKVSGETAQGGGLGAET
jgi:hypothetical protein